VGHDRVLGGDPAPTQPTYSLDREHRATAWSTDSGWFLSSRSIPFTPIRGNDRIPAADAFPDGLPEPGQLPPVCGVHQPPPDPGLRSGHAHRCRGLSRQCPHERSFRSGRRHLGGFGAHRRARRRSAEPPAAGLRTERLAAPVTSVVRGSCVADSDGGRPGDVRWRSVPAPVDHCSVGPPGTRTAPKSREPERSGHAVIVATVWSAVRRVASHEEMAIPTTVEV
jgi:hypothetical protein